MTTSAFCLYVTAPFTKDFEAAVIRTRFTGPDPQKNRKVKRPSGNTPHVFSDKSTKTSGRGIS